MQRQNIGAGNTEIILSFIFWILSKLVYESDLIPAVKLFKQKASHVAVHYAINILKRNSARDVENRSEQDEKYTLNISILTFLKLVSADKTISHLLQNKRKLVAEILVLE